MQFGIVPIECHPLVRYMLLFSSANYFQLNSIPQLTLHRSVIVSSIVISLLTSLQVLNLCILGLHCHAMKSKNANHSIQKD